LHNYYLKNEFSASFVDIILVYLILFAYAHPNIKYTTLPFIFHSLPQGIFKFFTSTSKMKNLETRDD